MILMSVLPGVTIGYGHGLTANVVKSFLKKDFIEIVVFPGMDVLMSRPRKSCGELNLHLKCSFIFYLCLKCFNRCFLSRDQGMINVQDDECFSGGMDKAVEVRLIGARYASNCFEHGVCVIIKAS